MFFRLVLLLVAAAYVELSTTRLVCYFTNWSQYRNTTARFLPEDVDPNLCTHLIYAFVDLNGTQLHSTDPSDEISWNGGRGQFERFTDLKKKNPSLITMLAVGGWTMASKPFSEMVANDSSRHEFATSAVKYLRDHNFDGLDIDWEYPANRGSPPEDKQRFGELLTAVRREFDNEARISGKPKLMLSVAMGAGKHTIDSAYDFSSVVKNVDMINLMTYDMHGSWENHTGHNSPLFPHNDERERTNMHWAVHYYLGKGVPASMMNIGVGLYGRTFTLADENNHGLGAPVIGPGDAAKFTAEKGMISYYEVCDMLKAGATKYYIADASVPYAVFGDQWIGYDDPNSLKPKVKYVKENHLGGIMAWSIDLDDFGGQCGQGKYPLLTSIKNELANITGTTNDKFCVGRVDHHYRDPHDCGKFYICTNGLASHEVCADGTVFNQMKAECDLPVHVTKCQKYSISVVGR